MQEEWRSVVGYEGLYEVSNMGRVRSLKECRGKSNIILKHNINNGYSHIDLYKNSSRQHSKIHRLVAQAFIPNPENKYDVNHIDSNRSNNIISNLEWVTRKENMEHCIKMGRNTCGEKQGRSKLKIKQVLQIRKSKLLRKEIAYKYDICISTVYAIKNRSSWKYLK